MTTVNQPASLDRWDIRRAADVDWTPWGAEDNARAKVLGEADGYLVALIEAEAGYRTGAHKHAQPEFLYLLAGAIRNHGTIMQTGDAYAAACGSSHTDFEVLDKSTYLSIFRL
jgi:hypothetical protein